MKEKYVIIITGAPATGKTTYGKKIAEKLKIPFFSKDKIKEILFECTGDESLDYESKRKIGKSSYAVFYNQAEELMKVGVPLILESNFVKESSATLKRLIQTYHYNSITIRFETELEVLHKRFLEREKLPERHPGLVANGVFDDLETFKKMAEKAKEFKMDDKEIVIDTTNFANIDFEKVIEEIKGNLK